MRCWDTDGLQIQSQPTLSISSYFSWYYSSQRAVLFRLRAPGPNKSSVLLSLWVWGHLFHSRRQWEEIASIFLTWICHMNHALKRSYIFSLSTLKNKIWTEPRSSMKTTTPTCWMLVSRWTFSGKDKSETIYIALSHISWWKSYLVSLSIEWL